jgi:hypothetical protein
VSRKPTGASSGGGGHQGTGVTAAMYAMLVAGDGRGGRGEAERGREISGRFLGKLLGLGSKARDGRGKKPRAGERRGRRRGESARTERRLYMSAARGSRLLSMIGVRVGCFPDPAGMRRSGVGSIWDSFLFYIFNI